MGKEEKIQSNCDQKEKKTVNEKKNNDTLLSEEGCCRIKYREKDEYQNLVNRLNRIEGQIRGIKGMLDKDAYCVDILTQISAVQAALNSFNKVLLSNHIKTCVVDNIRKGNDDVIDELLKTLQKVMK